MFSADPIDFRRLPGTDPNRINVKDKNQFNCVIEYLFTTYIAKIPTLTRERIVSLVANEPDEIDMVDMKRMGWKIQDIQRFCDEYKISHYVLDSFNRLIYKKIAPTRNYPALIYFCEDCHMYPVVLPSERIRIVKTFAEKTTTQSGILAQENEKKKAEAEKAAIKMFNKLPYYEDIDDLDELAKLKDFVVYYHRLHLKNLLMQIFQQTNVVYEFKHTGKLVTHIN